MLPGVRHVTVQGRRHRVPAALPGASQPPARVRAAFFAAVERAAFFAARVAAAFFAAALRVLAVDFFAGAFFAAVFFAAFFAGAFPAVLFVAAFFAGAFFAAFFTVFFAAFFTVFLAPLRALPLRLPPPSCLFTVAHAMRSAVLSLAPRSRSLS